MELERPSCSCRFGRAGLSPLDDALGVGAGGQQLDRQQAAVTVVTDVAYATAQSLCGALTGRPCGSARRPPFTTQVAEPLRVGAVVPSRQARTRRLAAVAAGRLRRAVMVLGMEGA